MAEGGLTLTRILVVEDDADLRTVIRIVLEPKGYEVVEAVHGAHALELMSSLVPDVVLADLKMPIVDGSELIRRMRRTPQLESVPVVILTGNSDARHTMRLGDAVLVKPFEPNKLLQTVEKLAYGHRDTAIAREGNYLVSRDRHLQREHVAASAATGKSVFSECSSREPQAMMRSDR